MPCVLDVKQILAAAVVDIGASHNLRGPQHFHNRERCCFQYVSKTHVDDSFASFKRQDTR